MELRPQTIEEVVALSRSANRHLRLFEKEVQVDIEGFSERVEAAEAGDVVAGEKLLRYLRGCLMERRLPDEAVADWAAQCLFEITHHGVDPNKAFSLKPETGRPHKGGNDLVALSTWEGVEMIRIESGLKKMEAIAAYQEKRHSLARLVESEGEKGTWEEISTLEKLYRRGANLVKRYLEETGK